MPHARTAIMPLTPRRSLLDLINGLRATVAPTIERRRQALRRAAARREFRDLSSQLRVDLGLPADPAAGPFK